MTESMKARASGIIQKLQQATLERCMTKGTKQEVYDTRSGVGVWRFGLTYNGMLKN